MRRTRVNILPQGNWGLALRQKLIKQNERLVLPVNMHVRALSEYASIRPQTELNP